MKNKHHVVIAVVMLLILMVACAPVENKADEKGESVSAADLSAIKSYLITKIEELKVSSGELQFAANAYYETAKSVDFDYVNLWETNSTEVTMQLLNAKDAWMAASPLYEEIEGIVAGVPSLSEYDVILDAGASAADDPENAVPFDLVLSDGRVFEQPGNLFGIMEMTLWGTNDEYVVNNVDPDLNSNGQIDFGEALPDANVLLGAVDLFDSYVKELDESAQAWEPTESDAFTALVVMVPTMTEYFDSWKNSRFVAGEDSSQADFVAISRLADIQDILSSLQVVYDGVKPMVIEMDSTQATDIENGLSNLKQFVADVYAQEQNGRQYTAEEAELLGHEAQNRATAITGQVSQVAAALNILISE